MTEKDLDNLIKEIKDLKIQGNTNIAKSIAKALLEFVTKSKYENHEELLGKLKLYAEKLANARPNEPISVNAVTFIIKDLEETETQQELRVKVVDRIQEYFKYIDESYKIIKDNAVNILKGKNTGITHCHSSLARDILIELAENTEEFTVINTETRPKYQGRITATKLALAGIRVIHIVDSMMASILLDERYPKPEFVIVGCDGITRNGDLVNKVGTYNLALAAKESDIPFYVVTQSMKIDLRYSNNSELIIESRDADEVWSEAPENVEILNPAFDLVPGKFITGYITEKGLMKPEEFREVFD